MKIKSLQRLFAGITASLLLCSGIGTALPVLAAEESDGQWQRSNAAYYYVLPDGTYATGEQQIDGTWYLFAPNGALQTGWQTVNDLRYYYRPRSNTAVFGWLNWRDETYYITKEQGKASGITETDRGLCYFDSYGVLQYGWFTDENGSHCYSDDEGIMAFGETVIDGIPYLFSESGVQQLGWQTVSDKLYYYAPDSGTARFEWLTLDGINYYLTPSQGAYIGEWQIDGIRYAFDENGAQIKGWHTFSDNTVSWYDQSGDPVSGMQSIDGELYYFSDDYIMQTGFQTIADAVYYFSEEGRMQLGFCTIDGCRYYFDENGELHTGWLVLNGDRYYCGEDGVILTEWQTIDGNTYYFSSNGIMSTGWQTIEGKQYYFTENGAMCTGRQTIDGAVYYLGEDGVRQSGIVILEGVSYAFGEDGVLCEQEWYITPDAAYYCDENGALCSGWLCIDGAYYYFGDNYAMAVSTTVDGYLIDEQGIASTEMKAQVMALLSDAGTTPDSIYAYVTANYRYRRIEETRTFEQLEAAGWDSLVEYLLVNKRGVCYYLAANMDYFLQLAGYETRIVYANHNTGNHYWCQVLLDGEWRNYDPTYTSRGNMSWGEIIAAGNYTAYGYLTVEYNERGDYLGITYEAYESQ